MTHTLHRRGTEESLKKDFVVFAIAAQTVNAKDAEPKFEKFFDIVLKYNPNNFGDMKQGNSVMVKIEEIKGNFKPNSIVHAVFSDEDTLVKVLKELKEADIGLSIVISGIIHNIDECCKKSNLHIHTVENSLGIWGRIDKLPPDNVLEITTMCGHGMISSNLVFKLADDVAREVTTPREAAEKIAAQCICGVVNIPRVEGFINAMADDQKVLVN